MLLKALHSFTLVWIAINASVAKLKLHYKNNDNFFWIFLENLIIVRHFSPSKNKHILLILSRHEFAKSNRTTPCLKARLVYKHTQQLNFLTTNARWYSWLYGMSIYKMQQFSWNSFIFFDRSKLHNFVLLKLQDLTDINRHTHTQAFNLQPL